MADPWFKFYAGDWRQDPALRMCSMAARGLWIELICLMHQSSPYGHLIINGHIPSVAQVAALVGTSPEQVTELLGELEAAGVFSMSRNGVIYSRKMTRMQKVAANSRKNGRKGGNPNLSKQRNNSAQDNPSLNPEDKAQNQNQNQSNTLTNVSDGQAVDFTKEVFDRGIAFLAKYGTAEKQARALIGKWRKQAGDTETFNALRDANREGVTEPVAWITARLKPREGPDLDGIFAQIREKQRSKGGEE